MDGTLSTAFCRLCSSDSSVVYISLFENQADVMLESLTSIKISPDDVVPNIACPKCLKDLKNAFDIQQKILKAQAQVEQALMNSEIIIKEEVHAEDHDMSVQDLVIFENSSIILEPDLSVDQVGRHEIVHTIKSQRKSKSENQVDLSTCAFCVKQFPTHQWMRHRKTHFGGFCPYCGMKKANIDLLRNHVETIHPTQSITVCEICCLIFHTKKAFDIHMKKTHVSEVTYLCDICGGKHFTIFEVKHPDVN